MKKILFNVNVNVKYSMPSFSINDITSITVHAYNSTEALIKVIEYILDTKLNKVVSFESAIVEDLTHWQNEVLQRSQQCTF